PNLEVKLFIADNTALFKSGNVGRCRDREMFFSLAFLFDFIIDYILVLYFSVAFLFLLFFNFLVWVFRGFVFRFLEPI
ncbi:hypothetical protein, partial [Helicobacter pylori]|uniref:hypothetical protein n=1 Tax=Helicobacter pylori TaxID=210 RepID=UPI003F5BC8D7